MQRSINGLEEHLRHGVKINLPDISQSWAEENIRARFQSEPAERFFKITSFKFHKAKYVIQV